MSQAQIAVDIFLDKASGTFKPNVLKNNKKHYISIFRII